MSDESQLQVRPKDSESSLILSSTRSSLVARGRRDAAALNLPCHKCGERKVLVVAGCVCADCSGRPVSALSSGIAGRVEISIGAAFTPFVDLRPGDLVVHSTHGVGRFKGLREVVQGYEKGDFMLLAYADDKSIYVPLTRLDVVSTYRRGVGP